MSTSNREKTRDLPGEKEQVLTNRGTIPAHGSRRLAKNCGATELEFALCTRLSRPFLRRNLGRRLNHGCTRFGLVKDVSFRYGPHFEPVLAFGAGVQDDF